MAELEHLFRPSDELKFILECFLPSAVPDYQGTSKEPSESTILRHKRIIAVVIHKDESHGWEEGSIFILKPKSFSSTTSDQLEIYRVYPVHGDFTITMAQLKQETSQLDTQRGSSGFKLTIHPNHTFIGSEPLDLATYDVSGLKDVLSECKRLKELPEIVPGATSHTRTFSWLGDYTRPGQDIYIPSVPYTLPDLREISKPIISRLSPAGAGTPGDDTNDIAVIRDDWARTRARIQCRRGRARLNVRLGTFNVNGKMPSQDLAGWVRGRTTNEISVPDGPLPTIKEISPLSTGEVVKDLFDSEGPSQGSRPSISSSSISSVSYSSVASKNAIYSPSTTSTFSHANTTNTASSFTLSSSTVVGETDNTSLASTLDSSSSVVEFTPVALVPPEVPTIAISQGAILNEPDMDPDILVLGFEELDLSTEALLYSTSTLREDAWKMAVFAALGEKAEMYEKLASKQLVGMLILIISKKSLRSCFSDILTSSVGAGIMGLMGNKGGTAIRLTFTPPASSLDSLDSAYGTEQHHHGIETPGPTVITFVVSHLAAFDDMFEKRNADFHDIVKRVTFDTSTLAVSAGSDASINEGRNAGINVTPTQDKDSKPIAESLPQSLVIVPEKFGVFESDILFWMGDLNYRIDLPDSDVRSLLQSDIWKDKHEILLHYDQLKTAIRNKKAFSTFKEHEIQHLPTYRFSAGISTDELGYDIKRKPAWTDRILHTFSPLTAKVKQLSYSGHPEITMSDHRPLSGDFEVDVDLYDKNQLQATAANLFRQVQGMEDMQGRARAKLSHNVIDLGDIFYKSKKTTTLRFHNCGKIPLAFRFVPIEMHNEIYPEWLSISHTTGLLLPNELIEITLTAFIDSTIASRKNLGPRNLDCTLIMHTMMGKDYFIAVSANYQYTCFANKLSRLTQLPGPIRTIKSHNDLLGGDRAINAPREIMRLVNWLMTCTHPADELFMTESDPEIIDDIREHLDSGDEFPYSHESRDRSISIAFGAALTELLKSLPECIVPKDLHGRCATTLNRDEAFEVLDLFPPEAVNVWISVTAFLHYFIQCSETPKVERIAATFAPVLFGFLRKDYTLPPNATLLGYQTFIKFFIE